MKPEEPEREMGLQEYVLMLETVGYQPHSCTYGSKTVAKTGTAPKSRTLGGEAQTASLQASYRTSCLREVADRVVGSHVRG